MRASASLSSTKLIPRVPHLRMLETGSNEGASTLSARIEKTSVAPEGLRWLF